MVVPRMMWPQGAPGALYPGAMNAPLTTVGLALAQPDRTLLLDGGLGTTLESRGHDLSSALWSARLLDDDPSAIRAVHRDFFSAGSDIAISASYQVSFTGMSRAGFDAGHTTRALEHSVALAIEARDEADADRDLWVAASVGPYGASLADGSEYRGDYGLGDHTSTVRWLREWHRPRLEVLAASGADLLAIETIPSLAEVEALALELAALDSPAWVSVTSAGGALRTGDALAEAWAVLAETPRIVAVGVNCLDPAHVSPALATASGIRIPLLIYPNSGEHWNAVDRHWHGASDFAASQVLEWRDLGARMIGGCCRVGPAEIAAMTAALS